jgi:hypothetical protein
MHIAMLSSCRPIVYQAAKSLTKKPPEGGGLFVLGHQGAASYGEQGFSLPAMVTFHNPTVSNSTAVRTDTKHRPK